MAGFFKELFSGIASVIEETADNVSAFFKRIRLGNKIKETQKNKVKLFCNLGELVYNLQMSGVINVKQCEGMCEEISEYDEKLRLLTEAEAKFAKSVEYKSDLPDIPTPDTAVCTDNEDDFGVPSSDL
ncbi:MAG: hypothetical protein PUD92_02285 [Clostridiales bacterium]|nr:hypothetical protein [Clostridiales bacterium]